MSDGLSDLSRSTRDAEKRREMLHEITACLKDRDDAGKGDAAVKGILAFQDALYVRDSSRDPEAAAAEFLSRLHQQLPEAWAQLLAFALKEYGRLFGRQEFRELKELSPFKGKTIVIVYSNANGAQIVNKRDLEDKLEQQLPRHGGDLLIALDCEANAARFVLP